MLIEIATNTNVDYFFRKVERREAEKNNYNRSSGWEFDWVHPFTHGCEVYALVTEAYPNDVQGLIAVRINSDPAYKCAEIEIVESAPHNKKIIDDAPNLERTYIGTGRCLIAFACQYSIDHGYEGYVGLTSKSSKFPFYESMGATRTSRQGYMFFDFAAQRLVRIYFPGGVKWWPMK